MRNQVGPPGVSNVTTYKSYDNCPYFLMSPQIGENFATGLYNLEISSSQLLPTKTSLPRGPGTQTSVPLFTHHTVSAPTVC